MPSAPSLWTIGEGAPPLDPDAAPRINGATPSTLGPAVPLSTMVDGPPRKARADDTARETAEGQHAGATGPPSADSCTETLGFELGEPVLDPDAIPGYEIRGVLGQGGMGV